MWILRFHLMTSKDYNKLSRICKKYGFSSRQHSAISYAKAAVKHATQKTSWRALGRESGIDHASLARFYEKAYHSGLLREIFHTFLLGRFALYIGENKSFDSDFLNNSGEIYQLTENGFEHILSSLTG